MNTIILKKKERGLKVCGNDVTQSSNWEWLSCLILPKMAIRTQNHFFILMMKQPPFIHKSI